MIIVTGLQLEMPCRPKSLLTNRSHRLDAMISAVVLARNEEQNITGCLAGLGWCDEILVIDDNSEDKTAEFAQKQGAKVIAHPLEGDFARQRNFGLSLAKGDWVLFVDADERVSPKLAGEIKKAISRSSDSNGFFVRRIDFFLGHWLKHGEIGGLRLCRLAKKNSGKWERAVDEIWEVTGKTKSLENPLQHYSHSDLTEFLTSINQRTSANAVVFFEEKRKLTFLDFFKPLAKFIWNYFFLLGFLDGPAGFVFAVMMSLHSFMVRGKLYLLWKKTNS